MRIANTRTCVYLCWGVKDFPFFLVFWLLEKFDNLMNIKFRACEKNEEADSVCLHSLCIALN